MEEYQPEYKYFCKKCGGAVNSFGYHPFGGLTPPLPCKKGDKGILIEKKQERAQLKLSL